jgi:uncharacterized membrane protein
MASIEKSIEVNVPLRTAYDQWTQFEEFPRFMEGITKVTQHGDKQVYWHANIGGVEKEWDSVITEQTPDQRISWRSTTGAQNDGTVSFRPLGDASTEVMLHLDYEPEGIVENIGDALGIVERRVEGDLQRFKEFIEQRGVESGGWRGEIHNEQVTQGDDPYAANRARAIGSDVF